MKQLITLLLFTVFAFAGCTKDNLCDAGKTASSLLAAQIAVQLDCKNVDAIKADVEKKLVELKVCEAPKVEVKTMGAIGNAICGPVVDGLTAGLLTQIPSGWSCSGGKVTDDVKLKLLEACSKAF